MCSRGVFQLQKLSLFFCDYGGSSAGVRQMITSPKLKDFLSKNPQIQFQLICKRNNHPFIRGLYINGYKKDVTLRSVDEDNALEVLESLRNQLGRSAFSITGSRVYGAKKSIQGKWQPNIFNKYPIGQLSKVYKIPDIPQLQIQRQVVQRNVRQKDLANKTGKSRPMVDVHDPNQG